MVFPKHSLLAHKAIAMACWKLLQFAIFPALIAATDLSLDTALSDDSDGGCVTGAAALELRQLRVRETTERINPANASGSNGSTEEADLAGSYSPEETLEFFLATQPDYNEAPSLSTERRSGHGRHGGHIKYLYHQTSTSAGPQILQHGFRRGHIGWCGGGIYFALSKGATYHKAVGVDSHHGFIIEAKVDLGRTKYMPKYCTSSPKCWGKPVHQAIRCLDRSYEGGRFSSDGYDSVYFNPGDGGEYMIWDPSRVISMKRV
eukprot:s2504_g7.t1